MDNKTIKLKGRIFLVFDIKTNTGLHIGGSDEGISIGGVDKTVIRDRLTNRPYIPGSSLRGKVRSLLEKYSGAPQNTSVGNVTIHSCKTQADYDNSLVCQVFGVTGDAECSSPTRLIVRDVQMSQKSADDLNALRTDLPYTEVKTEVAIDRVTSAANPRQMERVPAGTTFGDAEMIFSLYEGDGIDSSRDMERFKFLLTGLQLLEDDYLGGLGSRGSGKVRLDNIKVKVKSSKNYDQAHDVYAVSAAESDAPLSQLVANFAKVTDEITKVLNG
ncbi:MAG: type III-A CRISPR-associated RAMP protein Csm3 [Anaerolineales bacterium]|nr:type III-A CRISPR-associated RAMP protein Csm3 [Anaerolineales bacterium]